jgi:hypothetical protein
MTKEKSSPGLDAVPPKYHISGLAFILTSRKQGLQVAAHLIPTSEWTSDVAAANRQWFAKHGFTSPYETSFVVKVIGRQAGNEMAA